MPGSLMELRVEFRSESEWLQWKADNLPDFEAWSDEVAAHVRMNGLIEPVSRRVLRPASIRIVPNNYRESFSADELNCRKRALLLELETLQSISLHQSSIARRTYVIGSQSRIASLVAEFFPGQNQEDNDAWWAVLCGHGQVSPADTSYDLVCASDALELVPDLPFTLREVARVMRPGGTLLSGAPFDDTLAFSQRIQQGDGPICRTTVSGPVLQKLGWDVLDKCRDAGFNDVKLVLRVSTISSITANGTPGVFVLWATKGPPELSGLSGRWVWPAKRIRHVVGLIGIPRSGTTMLSAVLDAHNSVTSIYEPWNANRKAFIEGTHDVKPDQLLQEAEAQDLTATTMVVKETAAEPAYISAIDGMLRYAMPPITRHLLLLLRNPFHCFLSEIEGRRVWWGEDDIQISEQTFNLWASRTLDTTAQMIKLCDTHPSGIVFYEACVLQPQVTFALMMELLGLPAQPEQQFITRNAADLTRIRGDRSLAENARDVTAISLDKRSREVIGLKTSIAGSPFYRRVEALESVIEAYNPRGVLQVCRGHDYLKFVDALLNAID